MQLGLKLVTTSVHMNTKNHTNKSCEVFLFSFGLLLYHLGLVSSLFCNSENLVVLSERIRRNGSFMASRTIPEVDLYFKSTLASREHISHQVICYFNMLVGTTDSLTGSTSTAQSQIVSLQAAFKLMYCAPHVKVTTTLCSREHQLDASQTIINTYLLDDFLSIVSPASQNHQIHL